MEIISNASKELWLFILDKDESGRIKKNHIYITITMVHYDRGIITIIEIIMRVRRMCGIASANRPCSGSRSINISSSSRSRRW